MSLHSFTIMLILFLIYNVGCLAENQFHSLRLDPTISRTLGEYVYANQDVVFHTKFFNA
jgi:hypothetical protein